MMEFHTKYAFMSTGAVRRLLDERSAPQNKDLPDAEYMIPVVSMYAVNCPRTSRQWHPRDPTQIGVQHDFYGLWLEASQIKHSCISNANRSFIGDMQIIRASCNMPAGTQLAIWYQTPTDNYGEMLNGFAKWQLVCRCAYCVDLQTAPQAVIDERHRLIEKLGNMADENPLYPDDIEESVHLIQGTWYIHPWHVPRPTLVPIFVMLSRKYLDMCIPDRARSMCYRALESLGFAFSVYQGPPYAIVTINRWGLMTHDALDAFTHLCDIHVFSGAPHLAVQARDHAKLAYKIWIGEDATFDGYMEQASRYRHGFQALMP
ncbi:TPR domain-containing protein [Phlyctema vagabunda]|uniref:TPR domain-containing protein n=1 Tax=Phlyctema vagabunda TaxID=108571 RepID=A0ABR4PU35_9HELO